MPLYSIADCTVPHTVVMVHDTDEAVGSGGGGGGGCGGRDSVSRDEEHKRRATRLVLR